MSLPETMRAMVFEGVGKPLQLKNIPIPAAAPQQVLVKVIACGICRTDLHVIDGELAQPKLPLIPGHEIVGIIAATGSQVTHLSVWQLVGIPWLGHTCGQCKFCLRQQENLCENALFTGYTMDGGYADTRLPISNFVFRFQRCMAMPAVRRYCVRG